jgi:CheY-like chemotaxis protein
MHRQPTEYGTLPPTPEEGLLPYFDCILMDWEMPVCDGLRATKRIREIETKQSSEHNVIIGVTANARAEQIAIAVKAGMDTVMPKPFRVAELLAKISDFVMLDGSRS